MQIVEVGIAWYRRGDYQRILEIMVDRDSLPQTFDKWQGQAEKAEGAAKRAGKTVHRAIIKPDEFVAWCASRGLDVDASGRTRFAATPANWQDTH